MLQGKAGMLLAIRKCVGLWFTAGRRKCWGSQVGISGWGTFGRSILYLFLRVWRTLTPQTPAPSGIFQRQLQLARERIDRGSGLFQTPSLSNRMLPMRRPHGAITRPMARKSLRSACS